MLGAQTRDQIDPAREASVDQRDRCRGTAIGWLAQRRERPLRGIDAASRIALLPQPVGERSGETEIVIDDHHRTNGSVLLTHRLPSPGRAARPPVPTPFRPTVANHSFKDVSILMYSAKLYPRKTLNVQVRTVRASVPS